MYLFLRMVEGCPLVVHYWADLQSVHGFRCYDNIARTRNVSECLYSSLSALEALRKALYKFSTYLLTYLLDW